MVEAQQSRTVVITGGTGALGTAVSLWFLNHQYKVIVTYLVDTELKSLLEAVGDMKSRLDARRVDVTDPASLESLTDYLANSYACVDSLVCLVGGFAPGTLTDNTALTFDKMISLNGRSFLLSVEAVLPSLLKRTKQDTSWRQIIGVSARPTLVPTAKLGIYAASKAVVASLTRTLAVELLDDKISVNAVAPSTLATSANRKSMPKADPKKWVKPEELAEIIGHLCSEAGSQTSGEILPVYGQA